MPYLLDTDSASLAFQGHEIILSRIEQAPAQDVWLSSIAAEESMRGALALINHTRDTPRVFGAYSLFAELIAAMSEYPILLYDALAAQIYANFSAQVRRIGPQDCRIAASAISRGWTVVTANRKDFSRIPGVIFEDWSR